LKEQFNGRQLIPLKATSNNWCAYIGHQSESGIGNIGI